MKNLCRLYLLPAVALLATGCSSIHGSVGPDKGISDMRESVEAPVVVSAGESPFCGKPEMVIPVAPQIETAPEPYQARLYFLLDKIEFTPESAAEARSIYEEIRRREFSEISVVGHTDTAASDAYNDALSMRRAQRVKQDLVNMGVPAQRISISAKGQRMLLIQTPDETLEVRNRRVEINAR